MAFTFPRTHLVAIGLICLILFSLGMTELANEPQAVEIAAEPEPVVPLLTEIAIASEAVAHNDAEHTAYELIPTLRTIEHTVRSGESLALVFQRHGFDAPTLHAMATSRPHGLRLRNIMPGKVIRFSVDDEGRLLSMSYAPTPLEVLEFERNNSEFIGSLIQKVPEVNNVYRFGRIDQSLFVSAQRSGLSDTLIMELAKIFQWDIDFALDLRRGDEFSMILEELYLEGKFIGHRNILAAEFVNQGDVYRAVRFQGDSDATGYYTPAGKSLRKAFLRAPLEFSRISSNFNPRRVHPLFNRAMPHRGIDYAAPTGTPIRASGSGRVQIAGKTAPNGNYVVIQHSSEYQTKYLHLSRFGNGIRAGARVRQGDIIGYVGATGWATAPHLHYEFLYNGIHQNPRTVKLPNDAPIHGKELIAFRTHAKPLLFQLEAYRQGPQIAAVR